MRASEGQSSGQKPGGRNRSRVPGEKTLLIGVLFLACSTILHKVGPPAEGWHHPHWAGPYHVINYQPKTCLTDFAAIQPDGGSSVIDVPFPQKKLAGVKLTEN